MTAVVFGKGCKGGCTQQLLAVQSLWHHAQKEVQKDEG
jgi:hypothetical protein